MALSSPRVRQLVEAELSGIQDPVARSRIRELLVEPDPVEREWFYGTPGQRYTCWTVLQDPALNIGIAYCAEGFGPGHPWGFVSLAGSQTGIGPDYWWFPTLEAALKDSPLWDESGVAE